MSQCIDASLFSTSFIKHTEGLQIWVVEEHKGGLRWWVVEDRGRSVRKRTKTTPSDCRRLSQSLAWVSVSSESQQGFSLVRQAKLLLSKWWCWSGANRPPCPYDNLILCKTFKWRIPHTISWKRGVLSTESGSIVLYKPHRRTTWLLMSSLTLSSTSYGTLGFSFLLPFHI